jgi:N-terminal domain of anti-restriction factor ArdC
MTKTEMQAEALARAEQGESFVNYPAIYSGFAAKGIAESEIQPRVNVLTFQAWKAKGRVVKRGEHGVKVITWIPVTDKQTGEVTGKRPWTSTVFHISQTAELNGDRHMSRTDRYARADRRREYVRDPGEDAADRWNETHGDRWIEA